VAREPLGPAWFIVYIYGVSTLPNFIICTHCKITYCSPAIYSTGTPHFAFHSTSILRCQLSSNLNTRIANYAAHISTQQNKTCQFQHTTTPSLYQQKHTTSPLSPKSSTPPHLFRPHLLPASPYSPSSAPTIAVKQQSVLARGRRSNRLGCSRLLDLGSFRFSYSGFPSLWCLGSTLALSLSLELSSVLVDLRLVRVIRRGLGLTRGGSCVWCSGFGLDRSWFWSRFLDCLGACFCGWCFSAGACSAFSCFFLVL